MFALRIQQVLDGVGVVDVERRDIVSDPLSRRPQPALRALRPQGLHRHRSRLRGLPRVQRKGTQVNLVVDPGSPRRGRQPQGGKATYYFGSLLPKTT